MGLETNRVNDNFCERIEPMECTNTARSTVQFIEASHNPDCVRLKTTFINHL